MTTMLENFATTETAKILLQTLGTNSMIVKCKLDAYLMSTMVENYATSVTATVSLQIRGTNSMFVKGKFDVYLMSKMFGNCTSTETAKVLLLTLETKSMHGYTTVWCTSNLIPVSPTANKQGDVYTWNILTKVGTDYHLSLRYRVPMRDPSSKQGTLTTLDVYKWTLVAHFFIPLELVRSNPKVVRILTTIWVVSMIMIMSDVYTATSSPCNYHLSPGQTL